VSTLLMEHERHIARTHPWSAQTYARIAGALLLVSLVAGAFGEAFVPSTLIVGTDATATAHNIRASESLFRMGFAGYLVEAMCDIALALIFYVLLRPVDDSLALLAAFFGLVSTTTFAIAECGYLAAMVILTGADNLKAFSPDQVNALAHLSLKFCGYAGGVFGAFYGIASLVRGYLIFQARYLPRVLGVLFALGGLGFAASGFALILAPAYAVPYLLLPLVLGGLSLMMWLLVRGVDVPKWEARRAQLNEIRD
jgi:Domain of unknown function (DUF4386)